MKKITMLALLAIGLFQVSSTDILCKKISLEDLKEVINEQGVPVYFLQDKPFTGTTYDEYAVSQIYRQFEIVDGLIQKQTGWYFDGTKEREFSYRGGVLHGKVIGYHRSGNKYFEENYRDGLTDGRQYRYNCDGSLQVEWDCLGGIRLMTIEYEKKPCLPGCKVDEC